MCDGETSISQFPVTPTPVAAGSVFDYFSKPATNPSDFSQSCSSDGTATTQESDDTKSQSNDGMHSGAEAGNTLSCTNDDLLCLAASLFERKEEDIPSTLR